MSRFVRRFGFPVLALVCIMTLGWPHAVRTALYRSLYPLGSLDRAALAAPPSALVPMGYRVDDAADLAHFRDVVAPVAAGIEDESQRIRRLADFIYSFHPSPGPLPVLPGGRERGARAIFADIQAGKFPLCGQKTLVLAAMWRSLGGDVRQIRFSPGEDRAWYAAHYGIEVYAPSRQKWFYFDATLNGFAISGSGEPLSLIEINERLARGEDVAFAASREHFDWGPDLFLSSLRENPLQVYSLDNRFRRQDPDRRFGPLNFGYPLFSKLPRPFDKILDAVTGDAARRFVADPRSAPPAPTAQMHVSASPSGPGLFP